MPKLMRALVLGAMLAVLSSATAAVAQPPAPPDQAVKQVRAGERPSAGQPAREAGGSSLAEQRRWYYESTRVHPAAPSSRPADRGTPVALLVALAAAGVLALSLDALSVRRKTRKSAAHPAT
jgi:hypothetical protein